MLRLKRTCRVQARIPDASMADVAFLLIIFFLVTKSFYSSDRTPVTLPASQDRVRTDLNPRGGIAIAVTSAGELSVDNRVVSLLDIQNLAEGAVARDPNRTFIIRADQTIAFSHVDEVLSRLREVGVRNIGLETRSGGGGLGP